MESLARFLLPLLQLRGGRGWEAGLGLHDDMTATVDALYAAAVGQCDWHMALDRVVDTMGFTHASVYAIDRHVRAAATDSYRLPVSGFWHRHDPSAQQEYEAEYFKYELGRQYRLRHPDKRIYYDAMYGKDAELDRNPHYAWAEQAHGLRYFAYGQTNPVDPVGAVLVLHRSRGRGHITPDEVTRFGVLLQHFERAVHVEHQMGKVLASNIAAVDLLDRNPTGIVVLDGLGRVVLANRSARVMAEQNDSFALGDGRIAALRPQDDAALQRLIGAAMRTATGDGLSSGGALKLPRRSGKRDYAAIVAPLSRRESILSDLQPAVSVLISDPEAAATHSAAMLRQVYGITPAEQRLVERLMAGDTPENAARALGVAIPTVRTQLASVFRKTETRRQPELMRLLVSLPWWAGTGREPSGEDRER
jgi:DNA-binding CsgD family transcriptional regulator/PAS domain-containing protein